VTAHQTDVAATHLLLPIQQTMSASCRLTDLNPDTLHDVLGLLGPYSLAATSATCRALRRAADSPSLWSDLCVRRWHHPNWPLAGQLAQQLQRAHNPGKVLFAGNNGFHTETLKSRLSQTIIEPGGGEFVSSMWVRGDLDQLAQCYPARCCPAQKRSSSYMKEPAVLPVQPSPK
jgi:hypothetical protein